MDELSKQRADFVAEPDATPVVFGDGTKWLLPLPWVEIRTKFEAGKAVSSHRVFTHGREVDALLEAIAESDDQTLFVVAASSIAAVLIKRQYGLTEPELDALLSFKADDLTSAAWMHEVIAIANGWQGYRKGGD